MAALAATGAAAQPSRVAAEGPLARHALYVELGGAALVYSLNYEYRPLRAASLRAGFGALPLCIFDSCALVAIGAVSVQGLAGAGPHHLELGAGFMAASIGDDDARFLTPTVGYRYQRPHGGLLVRVSFTPLFRMRDTRDVLPWGGLSVGAAF